MRLVIIGPHFPEYCLRYAEAMATHAEVLTIIDGAQLDAEFEGRTIPALAIKRNSFRTPLDLIRMLRQIARFRPTVIHMQEAAGPRRTGFLACVGWMMRRSARIVLTVHDPMPHAGRDQLAARRAAGLRSHVRGLAEILVAHGPYCAGLLQLQARPGQRVLTSAHGVILTPPSPRPPPEGVVRLYAFGRMEAYKGTEILLEAAEALHRAGILFQLTVAGQGPELDRLEDRFRTLPEVTVRNGFISPSEVIESIQAAHCVVLPYLSATQSGVLAASFAGRRCAVATNTGGLPDVVDHGYNGLLITPADPLALAAAITRLAASQALRDELCAGAARTASTLLSWDAIAAPLAECFMGISRTR